MATHSSILGWKIPWTEEPGRLQCMGLQSQTQLSLGASLVVQMVKTLPAMQETWVQRLIWEDPLEKEMGTYSNILAWRIPWTEESSRLQSMVLQRVRHD